MLNSLVESLSAKSRWPTLCQGAGTAGQFPSRRFSSVLTSLVGSRCFPFLIVHLDHGFESLHHRVGRTPGVRHSHSELGSGALVRAVM